MKLGFWLALVGLAAVAAQASAQFVDFEDVASSGNPIVTLVDSGGFQFSSAHFHTIDDPASFGGVPELPGSTVYIGHEGGDLGRIITMTANSGGTFAVYGLDATKLWLSPPAAYPNATHVELVGYHSGGGSTTVDLSLAEPPGWQTYDLNPPLTDLTSLTINGIQFGSGADYGFGVDNIRLPEPTSLTLLGATLIFGLRRR
jgi:hypothetical protein